MAGHSHLIRRGARYYFRLVVPERLRPIIGRREFQKALGTADYRIAVERLVLEELAARQIFKEARRRLERQKSRCSGAPSSEDLALTPERAESYQSGIAQRWALENPSEAPPPKKARSVKKKPEVDAPIYRAALPQAPMFSPPQAKEISIGQLTRQYLEEIEKAGKAPKTILQYRVTARLLNDIFTEDQSACSLQRADAERFCTLLETMPTNMTKRYPGLSVEAAIEQAKKQNDISRLEPNTRKGRFFAVYTIFKYGVETRQLRDNPFDDRMLKQRFTPKDDEFREEERRVSFTLEELQTVFKAPLYSGCLNDRHGYGQPGPNVIRKGRFWVPLLALFHGMRLNEICQLHTKDIGDWEEGLFIDICPGEDKRLKNKPSRRAIPVHPDILKMGFGDYVAERRASRESPLLFPDLRKAKTGSFSDSFSKWFTDFLIKVFGQKIKATFHSFRHAFVDACRVADLSPQRIDRLCGWAGEGRQQREYGRARQVASLAGDLARVEYEGLDLTHLYLPKVQEVALFPSPSNSSPLEGQS